MGIGDLEKVLGDDFPLVTPFIKKGEGSPSLVPEDDARPSIDPEAEAKKVFDVS
jgi:hypothetical protein